MMKGETSSKNRGISNDGDLIATMFSWSLDDIYNDKLFKVEAIPESFESVEHYFSSYKLPLLEETRARLHSSLEIISRAPTAEVISLSRCRRNETLLYDIKVDYWRNRSSDRGNELYKTLPGDVVLLADAKPEIVSDLQRVGRTWTLALVTRIPDDEIEDNSTSSTSFKVRPSKDIEVNDETQTSLVVIFLTNMTTNRRIWSGLHMFGNLDVIREVLCSDSMVEENCSLCSIQSSGTWDENVVRNLSSTLNESQTEAILACLCKMLCNHKSSVELIWGPPGTGKTKTISMLLFTLLRVKCRILICAPTNVAITELASRVLKLVIEFSETDSGTNSLFCSLGNILLFGHKDRLKVNPEIEEIYLDYRVKRLTECFAPLTGWRYCFMLTIEFLEDCVCQYSIFLENELIKEKDHDQENKSKEKSCISEAGVCSGKHKSFLEFMRERFRSNVLPLKKCVFILCTHIPESFTLKHNTEHMKSLIGLLDSFEILLFRDDVISEELEKLFAQQELVEDFSEGFTDISLMLNSHRIKCLSILKTLRNSLGELDLPSVMSKYSIEEFCFQTASLIFCTASSSYKLHSLVMEPMNLLVIDEAAQLKECESVIPLQLPGIKHAILIGDECQLPATVQSNLAYDAGFGRSLFERLSFLGHPKHLLNMQYRMHPSISSFPNSNFYSRQIVDASNVRIRSYEKCYLRGPMFGPYSFIHVTGGREEVDDVERSRRNMVEVAVVLKLLHCLYREWNGSKQNLSIGVISPYAAQVVAIQEKLGKKYEKINGFSVKVQSIDGFQGSEEDIIIISTVRSNTSGAIGFVSDPRRVNVSLTRARHCLWILGNERTLAKSGSVWEVLLRDAKRRQCFFNADENKDLAKAIVEVKKDLDEVDDLLNGNSVLFKCARWKVFFSEYFRKSFGKLTSIRIKSSVLNLLLRLSSGWRPRKRNVDSICESSSQVLKQFKVEELYVICSIDIVREVKYIQVLKIWDLLPLEDIPRLVKRLNGIFERYTDDFISRCNEKCLDGDLEVPKTWSTSLDIVRYKSLSDNEEASDSNSGTSDVRCYVENSKVSDSLLLMKFYSLSSGVVKHLLSDRDGRELELPFEVTDEERDIIVFKRSTFILGRSGTGKTTVLTMKLFQKEQEFHMATEGLGEHIGNMSKDACWRNSIADDVKEVEDSAGKAKKVALHQLFVTVSPKLCYAVKHHVSQLKSFASGGKYMAEANSIEMENIDDAAQFKDIPVSFVDIPSNLYPLTITFFKFLMMLDGTVGNSYFERFPDVRQFLHGRNGNLGSITIQTFITAREVNYSRFCSDYWPRFNTQATKKLDPSRVFTEIMSHIKGGLQSGNSCDGRLEQKDYVDLSEGRLSTLSKEKREMIYKIYEDYERMKIEHGDFDLADFVIDLHLRLKSGKYEGDMMDFVYIDEVQDLTMRQIALFKHICRNVTEGFVFSGDTAQTIARGIDFRFEDIRSLFYNEFVLGSKTEGYDGRKEKGQISKIFHLSQNFRTHAGILKLSQSVIDLLYRFFHSFVDILSHETSLIFGEAPIWLEARDDENAIVTIFGNSGNKGTNFVGFGAEQVILVRDDSARKEVHYYVGKQALVLTVMECKGLEFQDVLLYNFFGSSPVKNKWRIIYEYMKEQNLLDESFPSFNMAKHNVFCSELKQLYVAITRTRQRLWICENSEELSKPMFDYWKEKALIQVRRLDDSLAQAMQVASSPEEWKSRGYKLLREANYEMATMCFERAGDVHGEKLAKAAGLKATADRMHGSNPKEASIARRQAAEIFESIGKAELAAECYCLLKEYERAGQIYLQCGESTIKRAGECFYLAGCYKHAAEVYASGNHFSECLSACTKGELFEMGLQYVQCWKQQVTADKHVVKRSREMDKIEQEFLEKCALHYYKLNDIRAMMRYVRTFDCMDSIRTFLNGLGCLDELLSLEEESGNFLEAAKIAKLKGEILLEADLLGMAGHFKNAAMLILWFVLANSLWSSGSKGWPLKQFPQKEELLEKAKSFAKKDSNQFYELLFLEAEIMLHDQSNLFMMKKHLNDSRRLKSIRGEILSARKILDAHFHVNSSKYVWENDLVLDLANLLEDRISKDEVSIETLMYFWIFWKDMIVHIFEYLGCLETQDVSEYGSYGEFCLNYLGVQRYFNNLKAIYVLMNSDADWVREIDSRYMQRSGKLICIDVHHFVTASRSYWSSELISVGMRVLTNLESLYKFSTKNSFALFCQSRSLAHIYEVSKFLLNYKYLDRRYSDNKELQKFIGMSTDQLFGCIYPLDWRESVNKNMIFFRRTETFRNLLKEMIFDVVSLKNKLSYGRLGRIALIILGSGDTYTGFYEKIIGGLKWNSSWNNLIKDLCRNVEIECFAGHNFEIPREPSFKWLLHEALVDAYNANWRKEDDYISPGYFLYLVERQLILLSCFRGYFLTTKSSFAEWLVYQEGKGSQTSILVEQETKSIEGMLKHIVDTVYQLLYTKQDTMEWIKKCHANVKDGYAVVVLRSVVIACLLYLNFGLCRNMLHDLLGRNYITEQLPRDFCDALKKRRKRNSLYLDENVLAEAFKRMGNPLVIVNLGKYNPRNSCPDAIFVSMTVNYCKENVFRDLFPRTKEAALDHRGAVAGGTASSSSVISCVPDGNSVISCVPDGNSNAKEKCEGGLPLCLGQIWELTETLKSMNHGIHDPTMKVAIEKAIQLLSADDRFFEKSGPDFENGSLFKEAASMLDELKQLYAAIYVSEVKLENRNSTIRELLNKLQSRRQRMEPFLSQMFSQKDQNLKSETSETSIALDVKGNEEDNGSKSKESCNSGKEKIDGLQAYSASENQGRNQNIDQKGKGNSMSKKNKKGKGSWKVKK